MNFRDGKPAARLLERRMKKLFAVVVALGLVGCTVQKQRTLEQCKFMYGQASDLTGEIEQRVRNISLQTDFGEAQKAHAAALIAESRYRALIDIMSAGNCCAYDETCMVTVGNPP